MEKDKEKKEVKESEHESKKIPFVFITAVVSGIIAMLSGILTIVSNISILTFNSQSVLSTLNSTGAVNSTTTAYLDLAFNGISSVKDGIIVLGPLLIIAGIFMVISAFYLKSKNKETRNFGVFLTFLFSVFALLGLLIYVPFNSLVVLILVYLPLTTLGQITYGLFIIYIVIGLLTGALALLKDKNYLS